MVDPKWTELSFSVMGGRCGPFVEAGAYTNS